MLQRHQSLKEPVLVIYLAQELLIFSGPEAETNFGVNTQRDLLPDVLYHKFIDCAFQGLTVVIIVIFSLPPGAIEVKPSGQGELM